MSSLDVEDDLVDDLVEDLVDDLVDDLEDDLEDDLVEELVDEPDPSLVSPPESVKPVGIQRKEGCTKRSVLDPIRKIFNSYYQKSQQFLPLPPCRSDLSFPCLPTTFAKA